MAAGNSYFLGINSNDFFLKDNKKAFILWLNVPKVTAYGEIYLSLTMPLEYSVSIAIYLAATENLRFLTQIRKLHLGQQKQWERNMVCIFLFTNVHGVTDGI